MDLTDSKPATPTLKRTLVPANSPPLPVQFFPPTAIDWNAIDLPLARWPAALDGFRILHLSDFHFRQEWPPACDLLIDGINASPPDLILFTGDFVDNKRTFRPAMPQVARLVRQLNSRFGCFAIHGNHDNYKIGAELGDYLTILDGKRQLLNLPPGRIEIIGLPGRTRWELRHRFVAAIPPAQIDVPRIVLSHYPDHFQQTAGLDADLFLAGHTHGGQICLPGGRPLIWHDSVPRHLASGINRIGKTWLVVSRGLGYTGIPLRTFCSPEVLEITCRAT